jgi:hypothetical protein
MPEILRSVVGARAVGIPAGQVGTRVIVDLQFRKYDLKIGNQTFKGL